MPLEHLYTCYMTSTCFCGGLHVKKGFRFDILLYSCLQ